MKYVLALGTNIGNRIENINKAVDAVGLAPKTKVLKCSAVYETEPVGYDEQQNFYNCVILVESSFNPYEMLGVCLGIECGFGRVRELKNGPRILDIDLLLADGKEITSENLTMPHPRIRERRFVMQPLLDIFENGTAFGFEFKTALENLEGQKVIKIREKIDFE